MTKSFGASSLHRPRMPQNSQDLVITNKDRKDISIEKRTPVAKKSLKMVFKSKSKSEKIPIPDFDFGPIEVLDQVDTTEGQNLYLFISNLEKFLQIFYQPYPY